MTYYTKAKKYNLQDKVALVTGASSGIGAAIAIQFAQYGAKLVITGRNAENLRQIGAKIESVSLGSKPLEIVGDLLHDAMPKKLIDQTVAHFGQLDILVNNAGGGAPKGTLASENLMKEYDEVMKLNVRSVLELTQRAVPHLELTKGNVINISSIAGMKPVG